MPKTLGQEPLNVSHSLHRPVETRNDCTMLFTSP